MDFEVILFVGCDQGIECVGVVCVEVEVVIDYQLVYVQVLYQDFFDEVLWGEGGEMVVEMFYYYVVDVGVGECFKFVVQVGDMCWGVFGGVGQLGEEFMWMWFESYYCCVQFQFGGGFVYVC